jgi:hypothetical protein
MPALRPSGQPTPGLRSGGKAGGRAASRRARDAAPRDKPQPRDSGGKAGFATGGKSDADGGFRTGGSF